MGRDRGGTWAALQGWERLPAPACPTWTAPVPCPPPCPQVDSSSAARPGAQVIAPCKQKQRDRAYKEAARLQGADGLREVVAEDQAWLVALGPQV